MRKVVLAVEDDAIVRRILRAALEPQGYDVVTKDNGRAAIEWAKTARPNVVLLDLMLFGMSGVEVGHALNTLYGGTVPLVIVSAMDIHEISVAADEVGAFGFLGKPFTVANVRAVVGAALEHEAARHRQ